MSAPIEAAAEQTPEDGGQKTEAFTMKDDPDLELSDKELDMVAKAIGLKNKAARKKKR